MKDHALEALRARDPGLAELAAGDGSVLVSPALQGRIFCAIGGELLHRLDLERLAKPAAGEFNNLGGNSLWPAPEGGPFAFNYLPGDPRWVVQPGIADEPCRLVARTGWEAMVHKEIALRNRAGTTCRLLFSRHVRADRTVLGAPDADWLARAGVRAAGYESLDMLEPLDRVERDRLLLAAWSLEQFPGGEGVTAFARVADPETAVNFDFYGLPERMPDYRADHFLLPLGGAVKFQIGVRLAASPLLLGALDRKRGLLVLREAEPENGVRFNIADNDQPAGPFSAADAYSVFNGGPLDFFELETIGAMRLDGDRVGRCALRSRTWLARGPAAALRRLLADRWGIDAGTA